MKNEEKKAHLAPSPAVEARQPRFALLIDADNAQASIVENLIEEIARYGVASVRRIYGDWTQPSLQPWKATLVRYSIVPVQQFTYTKGKNSTDSSLIIDAMDLMYTRRFDGFCIVSSDSDFTRLASRLREEGLTVLGFGEKKTPESFVAACDRFTYTEVLRPRRAAPAPQAAHGKGGGRQGASPAARAPAGDIPEADRERIFAAIEATSDEDGWSLLSNVGTTLIQLRPDFDPRLFGCKKLSDLMRAMRDVVEMEERSEGPSGTRMLFVRPRQ